MNFRNVVVVALAAVNVISCHSQPKPYCPVQVGSPLGFPSPGSPLAFSYAQYALPNFWGQYKLRSGTGACSQLPGEEIGFQRFEVPNKPMDITVAIRPFTPSYMRGNPDTYGSLEWADYDTSNDDVDADAGTVLTAYPDPVFRTDPSDPEGKNLNGTATIAPDPAEDDACLASTFTPIDVTFQEEVLPLVPGGGASARAVVDADAGTITYPELHIRYEWDSLRVVSTTEIPGTIFTAQLRYTEDTCTATYDVTGIWPITLCHTDLDCSPNPVGDGPADSELGIQSRRLQGSGLNPAYDAADAGFPLRCNNSPAVHAYTGSYGGPPHSASDPRIITDFNGDPVYGIEQWGVCEMTRPVTDFTMGR